MDTEDLKQYIVTILLTLKKVGHWRCEVRIETLRRLICDLTNEVDNVVSHAIGNLEQDNRIKVDRGWVEAKWLNHVGVGSSSMVWSIQISFHTALSVEHIFIRFSWGIESMANSSSTGIPPQLHLISPPPEVFKRVLLVDSDGMNYIIGKASKQPPELIYYPLLGLEEPPVEFGLVKVNNRSYVYHEVMPPKGNALGDGTFKDNQIWPWFDTPKFKIPYELEECPPRLVMVDGRVVILSRGWRLARDE